MPVSRLYPGTGNESSVADRGARRVYRKECARERRRESARGSWSGSGVRTESRNTYARCATPAPTARWKETARSATPALTASWKATVRCATPALTASENPPAWSATPALTAIGNKTARRASHLALFIRVRR